MQLSRRRLLGLAPAGALLAACGLPRPRPRVNVRDFGAAGDGSTDDSAAIISASAALRPGQTLHFPSGSYRFGERRPPGRAAVVISGLSDVAVDFADGAELVMDNLDAGLGTSHGILVRGRAAGVTLRNVRIRWRTRPEQRSFGDGIRIVGFPGDTAPPSGWTGSDGPVSDVRILDCEVRSSPQAGVILMGVSDIRVGGLVVRDTLADGLHFNACRRGRVTGHRAYDTGDDGLALVTYYSETFAFNTVNQTFSFPALTDWSDADFEISDVEVLGGRANGVRIAGANGVRLRGLTVRGKQDAGVIADSAAPGVDDRWSYMASRNVRIDRVHVEDCDMGLHLLARPGDGADRRFTRFGLTASGLTIRDCRTWGVRGESLTAQRATGLQVDTCTVTATSTVGGDGGVGLQNIDGTRLGRIRLRHDQPVTIFSAFGTSATTAAELDLAISATEAAAGSAEPCAVFQDAAGRVDAMRVRWPAAPETWQPIRITAADGDCSALALGALSVQPATVTQPVSRCG